MATTATAQARQTFSNLRRRLDQLGYQQPLGVESLPLVEKLFADLVHTTESLKNAKLQLGQKKEQSVDNELVMEPFRNDNARLIKENNELHLQLIKQKEDLDCVVRELKASLRKLEHENADLKFLNNQYVYKVKQMEKDSKQKSERILQLQEKNFQAVVQTPGGHKKSIPFRRQRMEIDTTVPDTYTSSALRVPPPDDPYVADLLQVADSKIAQLESEVSRIEDEKEVMDRKLKTFRQQVEGRDEEIERLSRMLDGGRSSDVVALESKNRSNERTISHLNIQVDFLQQKNRELERKFTDSRLAIDEAESKLCRAHGRVEELEAELRDVGHKANRLQTDREVVVQAADREMGQAKNELMKSRHELEDLDNAVAQLTAENKRLARDCSDAKAKVAVWEADSLKLEDLLDRLQDEKKRLIQRNNKLTANEKELVLEIERLKKKKNGPVPKKGKVPSKLDFFILSLEEERDYYKQQTDMLQRLARGEKSSLADRQALSQQEAMIRVMEEEKEYYKKEYENLKGQRRTGTPTSAGKTAVEDSEIFRLTLERDELKALLDKFERHMSEIQSNVRMVTAERDKLDHMYQETKEELMEVRREMASSPKPSLAAQAVLRRVENERDDAVADLHRLTSERDGLRDHIKTATESSVTERAKMERLVEDLEASLRSVESERDELQTRVASLREDNHALEKQSKDQTLQLSQLDDEVARFKSSSAQMKMLVEETEKTLDEMKHRLSRREKDLQSKEEQCSSLQDQLAQLQTSLALHHDQLRDSRNTLAALDREKDALQASVDDKTEKVSVINTELHDKERVISDLKVRMGEMEAELHHADNSLTQKDREIKSLRRQVESGNEDLQEASRGRDLTMQDNRRLQDDLMVMTKENQKLNEELQDVLGDRECLKTQVQQYILEVRRVEDTLASKEQERCDLLDQYRKLSMEAEQAQTVSNQLESEGSNMRLELMTKDSELRRAHDKLDNLGQELQEYVQSQQAYEQQVLSLTRSLATLEDNLRQAEQEKACLRTDYTAARENSAQMESVKEQLLRKQTALQLDREQLQSLIEDLRQESECLHSQVAQERSNVKSLEGLLQSGREKEFQNQISSQELSSELQMLRDRLSLNDNKIQGQGRELASLRTRNVELEGDMERLRRQLTNERFERERAVQELRRNGISPPIMISDYSSESHQNRSTSSEHRVSRSRSPSASRNSHQLRSHQSHVEQGSPDPYSTDDYTDTSVKGYATDVL